MTRAQRRQEDLFKQREEVGDIGEMWGRRKGDLGEI